MKNKLNALFGTFKAKMTVIISACVAVAILAVLIIGAWKDTSYVEAMETFRDVVYRGKADQLKDLAPKEFWNYIEDTQGYTLDELEEEYARNWESRQDMRERQHGGHYRMSYEIVEDRELSETRLNKIKIALKKQYDIDKDDVKAGKKLTVMVTTGGLDDSETEETTFTVVKIRSDWYVVNYDFSDGEGSVTFGMIQ